jgi:hypothetical protein
MQKKQKKHRYRSRLLIAGLISAIALTSGCKTPIQLDNTKRLIEQNHKGFWDAMRSSPEGRQFVEDTLETIIDLEYEIEKAVE